MNDLTGKVIELMQELTTPIHNDDLTDVVFVEPLDAYMIRLKNEKPDINGLSFVKFQKGPTSEGINGYSTETLISICLHRLMSLNKGEFVCEENNKAIECLHAGLIALEARVERRKREGTYGTLLPDNKQ